MRGFTHFTSEQIIGELALLETMRQHSGWIREYCADAGFGYDDTVRLTELHRWVLATEFGIVDTPFEDYLCRRIEEQDRILVRGVGYFMTDPKVEALNHMIENDELRATMFRCYENGLQIMLQQMSN